MVALAALSNSSSGQTPLAVLHGDEPGDRFGAALAVTGDVDGDGVDDFIVGAPAANAGGVRRGKAWVFSGADRSVLHVFVGTHNDHQLGYAVTGAGDIDGDGHEDLIIGEPWPGTSATTPGHASVFSGANGTRLLAFEGDWVGDDFGSAVADVGDLNRDGHDDVAVGARDHGCPSNCSGRVVVFSGADGAVLLDVEGSTSTSRLGWSVAGFADFDGDGTADVLAGAPLFGVAPFNPGPGAVCVLSGLTGQVLETAYGVSVAKAGANIGKTVAALPDINGDGSPDFAGGGEWTDYGNGQLLLYSGAGDALLKYHEMPGGPPPIVSLGDVDGDGDVDLAFGERGATGLASPDAGAVVARDFPDWTIRMIQRGDQTDGLLGATLAVLGDADADGRPELLAGAPGPETPPSAEAGRVVLFEYAPLVEPALVVKGDGLAANGFGSIVKAAGDVDNDGAPDVISGEPEDSTVAASAGRARVHSGRDGSVLHEFFGDAAQDQLGWSVAGVGDLDRDGHADVVVGIPFRKAPLPGAIRAYSGRTGAVLLEAEGAMASDRFGLSVAGVGDVNGDLVPDILVGAPNDGSIATGAGAAYLLSGASGESLFVFHAQNFFLGLGNTVGGGGDVDADGVPDLLISVPNAAVGFPPYVPGTVRVFSGATGTLLQVLGGQVGGGHFGAVVDDAGDVDGDGHADIVITDPDFPISPIPPGRVYVISGASFEVLWTHSGAAWPGKVGQSVAGMGDVDGDGLSDVLVGVPNSPVVSGLSSEVRVLSGADGSLIQAYVSLDSSTGLGTQVDRLGDFDLDGRSDVLGGATKAQGKPDGQFTIWPSGDGNAPWSNLGAVLPGAHGAPSLLPSGALVAGQPVTLALSGALESAPAALVVGFSELNLRFKGGTLVPSLTAVFASLFSSPAGSLLLSSTWPAGVPAGQPIYAQFWIADPAAPNGFAASNAVVGVAP